MTFYNIVFGILFVGTFREVLRSLAAGPDWTLFFLAATLSILVFSDTIYTSVVVEGKKKVYSVEMMLLDLLSFVILSLAIVTINPSADNLYQVNVSSVLDRMVSQAGIGPETVFWILLSVYMCNLIAWNRSHDCYRGLAEHRWLEWIQPTMLALFVGMALVTYFPDVSSIAITALRPIVMMICLAYLLGYKPFLIKIVHDRKIDSPQPS
jgi:hypothetical protein